jgi:D-Tyr-tRNAtyr deacylase
LFFKLNKKGPKLDLIQNYIRLINQMGYEKKLTLNESQVASIISASPSTLCGWRKQGLGPEYIKIAAGKKGRVMYPKLALAEWLANTIKTA